MADRQTETADALLAALEAAAEEAQAAKNRRHVHTTSPGSVVLGVRMGTVFDLAKAHRDLALGELDRLLDSRAYEARLAAVSVLDLQVRPAGRDEGYRRDRFALYLDRHDRIDNWDLVDRAAPRVVGAYLADRDRAPLYQLAGSPDHHRRRTATVATMWFARAGDLADVFGIADALLADPHEATHKAVGATLRYASAYDADAVLAYLRDRLHRISAPALTAAAGRFDAGLRRELREGRRSAPS